MRLSALVITATVFLASCTSVVNTFTSEPIQPDPTKQGVGSSINDMKMETYIGVNIKKADPALDDANINVTVVNSIVLLTGEVPTKELKVTAGTVARAYTGVRKVHNELQVRSNSSMVSKSNDSLLSTQIRTKLLFNGEVDSSQVTVVTSDSTVYLIGITTQENGRLAAEVASSSSGVRKVVKAFEYVD